MNKKPAYLQDEKRYCEDCKWIKIVCHSAACVRPVSTDVHREEPLNEYADGERRKGTKDACGKEGRHWERYIPPKKWWQKLGDILNQE
jgi:hypothetical protein